MFPNVSLIIRLLTRKNTYTIILQSLISSSNLSSKVVCLSKYGEKIPNYYNHDFNEQLIVWMCLSSKSCCHPIVWRLHTYCYIKDVEKLPVSIFEMFILIPFQFHKTEILSRGYPEMSTYKSGFPRIKALRFYIYEMIIQFDDFLRMLLLYDW